MRRFKPRTGSWSVTPLGWVLFGLVAAGVTVSAVGPGSVQAGSLLVAVLACLMIFGGGLSGGQGVARRTGKTIAQRRAEFGPRRRSPVVQPLAEPQENVWERERERRERPDPAGREGASNMPEIGV